MKKPMKTYKTNYPQDECASYYVICETLNGICNMCYAGGNTPGPIPGPGPSGPSWN